MIKWVTGMNKWGYSLWKNEHTRINIPGLFVWTIGVTDMNKWGYL